MYFVSISSRGMWNEIAIRKVFRVFEEVVLKNQCYHKICKEVCMLLSCNFVFYLFKPKQFKLFFFVKL